ncbi:hypothetical protein EB796_024782 [Bugula neritina]|uniref:RRM domain-containing protein n=1 Tax=Bugula neritina TaxID=10212 RepID=A0A7J7IU38_BUGNE|nr:hypothetical protein EB796_024782 [Bugula neritina]
MDPTQTQYIQVVEEEFDDAIELPVESDGTLLITTLSAQFPGATGLKYRNESTGNWRGVRVVDGKLQAPDGIWSETLVFCVVYPKDGKRKGEPDVPSTNAKVKRQATEYIESQKTTDLVLLGLAYTAEESDIKEYFETFGTVLMTQIKRDHDSQRSKGFGFIRMADYDAQIKILSQRHMVCGRWCEVKLPNSNTNRGSADSDILNRKIFVGRCTEEVTQEDLRDYFSKFGEVVDVYIPKPFRAFAFVTFASPNVAASLCGQDHIINNASVNISSADPKDNNRHNKGGGDDFRGGRSYRGSGPSNRGNQQMSGANQSQGMHQGNMSGNMGGGGGGGFNMNGFPMNPAMFAALAASQGMFPMMNGNMGNMGGFQGNGSGNGSQSGYGSPQNQGNSGYGSYGGGYNQGSYSGGYNNGSAPAPAPWSTNSSTTESKDAKGASGWSQHSTN